MKPVICLSALLAAGILCQCSPLGLRQANRSSQKSDRHTVRPQPILPREHGDHSRAIAIVPAHGRHQPADISRRCVASARSQCLSTGYLNGVPTEYLRLLDRYLHQARELQMLAGSSGTIHVANCADAEPLLSILGYRARPTCGQKDSVLATADPERAFLTTDSGFPLTALEEALEKGDGFYLLFPQLPRSGALHRK